jgi:hypothetical protein
LRYVRNKICVECVKEWGKKSRTKPEYKKHRREYDKNKTEEQKLAFKQYHAEWTLSVDHNHVTNKVRALLCDDCNVGIGTLGENPERLEAAAAYLRHHSKGG